MENLRRSRSREPKDMAASHLTDQTVVELAHASQVTVVPVPSSHLQQPDEEKLRLSDLITSESGGPSPAISNNERLLKIQQI